MKVTITLGAWESAWFKAAVEALSAPHGAFGYNEASARKHLLRWAIAAVSREVVMAGGQLPIPFAVSLREATAKEVEDRVNDVGPNAGRSGPFDLAWLKEHFPDRWSSK